MKLRIGITGQNGFIGKYLYNTIKLTPDLFEIVDFERDYFEDMNKLDAFVDNCDLIVHLAALNRHNDPEFIYRTNINLVKILIDSLERVKSSAHVIMSSSLQEEKDNLYGKSKKDGRKLFVNWAVKNKTKFTGLIIPNVFGPFGDPYYNSVVATFCHQLCSNETPIINNNNSLKLIYVGELVMQIIDIITNKIEDNCQVIKHTHSINVSELLDILVYYKEKYLDNGEIPVLNSVFNLNLFNTFRSYINVKSHFPIKFKEHIDSRGSFVEIIRLGIGGQMSFSTTLPNITRGNHFHTRKIERFAVIKGKALIQLRKVGSNEVLDFYLDGDEPAYIDMPIWYTHNIKNIGDDILYTNFWINEPYDQKDADTYFINV